MKKYKNLGLIVATAFIFVFVLVAIDGYACTGIRIETQDGNYIFARTLEFSSGYISFDLITVPRNYNYVGRTPTGKPGMTWKTTYGYVGFNPFGMNVVADGLNEKGLACGSFFFNEYAQYEEVAESNYSRTISCLEVTSWILSTCASVSEVREKLPKIHVSGVMLPELGYIPPIHYFVADKKGDAIIIEYIDGKINIHDNKVNVLTNSPDYIWHTTNVENYIGLKPTNVPPVTINGIEIKNELAQGTGAFGLPGDFTSPSRFIRASFFADATFKGKDADEGAHIAFHILNQFDIPKGSVRGTENGKSIFDATQWTSASDLTNSRYFYHTYNDRSVRMIDLKKINLDARDIKSIKDVQKPGEIKDVSGQFK